MAANLISKKFLALNLKSPNIIPLVIIITFLTVFSMISQVFLKPALNYGIDPYMEEFCSSVKIQSENFFNLDQKPLPVTSAVEISKCASYYAKNYIIKAMWP